MFTVKHDIVGEVGAFYMSISEEGGDAAIEAAKNAAAPAISPAADIAKTAETVKKTVLDNPTVVPEVKQLAQVATNKAETGVKAVEAKTNTELTTTGVDVTVAVADVSRRDIAKWNDMLKGINVTTPEDIAKLTPEQLEAYYSLLAANVSDFDGKSGVEAKNKFVLFGRDRQKYMVGELQLYNIFQAYPKLFQSFAESVGKDATVKDIQDAILAQTNALSTLQQALTGTPNNASVDVITVLSGKQAVSDYVAKLVAQHDNLPNDKVIGKTDLNMLEKAVSTLLSIGVSVATLGKVYVRYEKRDLIEKNPLALVLGKGPVNLTAKLSILAVTLQANVQDNANKIYNDTQSVLKNVRAAVGADGVVDISKAGNLSAENTALLEAYNKNPVKGGGEGVAETIAYNTMMEGAKKIEGEGWNIKGVEASYNIADLHAYAGLAFQKISTKMYESDGAVTRKVAEGVINETEKNANVVVQDKQNDGTYIYSMPGDVTKQFVNSGAVYKDGYTAFRSPVPLDIKSSVSYLNDGKIAYHYEVTNGVVPVAPTQKIEPKDQGATESREVTRDLQSKLGSRIYTLTRNDPVFSQIMKDISMNEYDKAYTALTATPKYKDIASALWNPSSPVSRDEAMNALLTYSYGSIGVMKANTVDKKLYSAARSEKVLKAEQVLLTSWASGATIDETVFKNTDKFTPKNLKDMYPGQAVSASVFATPSDRVKGAGIDRIDHFDASIQVTDKSVVVDTPSIKNALISSHGAEIKKQLVALNEFTGKNISEADYTAMLLGTKKPSEVAQGLDFQANKGPAFIETRAMVRGNACANLTYALAYPLFKYEGSAQPTVVTENVTSLLAPSAAQGATVQEVAVGLRLGRDKVVEQEKQKEDRVDEETNPNPPGKPIGGEETTVNTGAGSGGTQVITGDQVHLDTPAVNVPPSIIGGATVTEGVPLQSLSTTSVIESVPTATAPLATSATSALIDAE